MKKSFSPFIYRAGVETKFLIVPRALRASEKLFILKKVAAKKNYIYNMQHREYFTPRWKWGWRLFIEERK